MISQYQKIVDGENYIFFARFFFKFQERFFSEKNLENNNN